MPTSPTYASELQPPADPGGDPHDPSHEQGSPDSPGQQESTDLNRKSEATSNDQAKPLPILWSFDRFLHCYHFDWTQKTDVAAVRKVLEPFLPFLPLGEDPMITYDDLGSYHRVFGIRQRQPPAAGGHSTQPSFFLRVALPTTPYFKTVSEVTTMCYIRQRTTIPVPEVYAFDPTPNNALGHEWILMRMVDNASTYDEAEGDMTLDQKLDVARILAEWVDQLSSLRFNGIGGLYNSYEPFPKGPVAIKPNNVVSVQLGPVASEMFEGDWRHQYRFDRGPYSSVAHFAKAILDMHRIELGDPRQHVRSFVATKIANAYQDHRRELKLKRHSVKEFPREELKKQCREWAEAQVSGPNDPLVDWDNVPYLQPIQTDRGTTRDNYDEARQFSNQLCHLFAQDNFSGLGEDLAAGAPQCFIDHPDITRRNVLIDNETKMPAALLDWESVITAPLYMQDFYPGMLFGLSRSQFRNDDLDETSHLFYNDPSDREEVRLDYTFTLMRKAFRDRLAQLQSPYLALYKLQKAEHGYDIDPGYLEEIGETPPAPAPKADDWKEVWRQIFRQAGRPLHYAQIQYREYVAEFQRNH